MSKHPLEKYLEDNEITRAAFAEKIGFSRMTVHRIIKREGNFSMVLMESVSKHTGGAVKPSDFFEVA